MEPDREERVMVSEDSESVKSLVCRLAAHYDADSARRGGSGWMADRRQAQIIVCAEVLRILRGDVRTLEQLADVVPLTPTEVEAIAHGLSPDA